MNDTRRDVESDPGLGDEETDWAGEGGATPQGPATDPDEPSAESSDEEE